jgi:hypothetical protein
VKDRKTRDAARSVLERFTGLGNRLPSRMPQWRRRRREAKLMVRRTVSRSRNPLLVTGNKGGLRAFG